MFIGIHVSYLDSYIAVHKFDLAPLQKHLLVREQLCNRLLLEVFGCLHILRYGAWLSFVQSLPVTLLVLCYASCASLAGFLVLSIWSFFVLPNNSFAFFCGFVVLIALHIVLMSVIVFLFFSPCGHLSYVRTVNMKAVTFSIQAIDD